MLGAEQFSKSKTNNWGRAELIVHCKLCVVNIDDEYCDPPLPNEGSLLGLMAVSHHSKPFR